MATTALQIDQKILTLLGQTSAARLGTLPSGTSTTPTITAQTGRLAFANDAANLYARAAGAVPATATGTLATGATAASNVRLSTLTVASINGQTSSLPTGTTPWGARKVIVAGAVLPRLGERQFQQAYSSASTAAATPSYWCRMGTGGSIAFGPPVTGSSVAYTVECFVLPGALGDPSTDTIGFSTFYMDDIVLNIICPWAAFLVASQRLDTPQIAMHRPALAQMVVTGLQRQWGDLMQSSPDVAAFLYGGRLAVPEEMVAAIKGGGA
jgi:hypothetical protein